jgi:glycerate dehydrogenase
MKIVVFDGYSLNPGDLDWSGLNEFGEYTVYDRTGSNEIIERAIDADVILTNKTCMSDEVMGQLPNLKFIGVLSTGYNTIDIAAAKRRGIIVTNTPSYSTNSVAQMVFAHILNITQQVAHYTDEVHQGTWERSKDFCFRDTELTELTGLKLGIIGYGTIGQAVARIALGFGMEICAYTHKSFLQIPREVTVLSLDEIYKQCDVISLHCPLDEHNQGMINAEALKKMKPTAILINTGRGGLINEQDLANALDNNVIAAAGLDVLSCEPPKSNNPLLKAKNCYITPHIAWATKASRTRLITIVLENLREFHSGGAVTNNVAK